MLRVLTAVLGAYVLATAAVALLGVGSFVGEVQADEKKKDPTYISAAKCKKCHLKQFKSWSKSKLKTSFDALKPDQRVEAKKAAKLDPKKDYTKDPTCLKCHTTGYGTAHGYPAVVKGKTWTDAETARAALTEGIHCEACHGPGSLYSVLKKNNKKYKRSEIVALGAIAPPNAASCAPCHVKECPTMPADYKFDFEKDKLSEGIHKHKKLKYNHDG
ncbi:MAG: cytochrome c family protein [Planctomycetota bacterium]|nr:cytochrome c family protein [Planctomycetota bacterium]